MKKRNRFVRYLGKHGEDMNEERKSARSKSEFLRLAGIGPDLVEFVTEFVEKPAIFFHCLSKGAAKLKIRWTPFYFHLRNGKPFITKPSTVLIQAIFQWEETK